MELSSITEIVQTVVLVFLLMIVFILVEIKGLLRSQKELLDTVIHNVYGVKENTKEWGSSSFLAILQTLQKIESNTTPPKNEMKPTL
jgi:hypothetical protein